METSDNNNNLTVNNHHNDNSNNINNNNNNNNINISNNLKHINHDPKRRDILMALMDFSWFIISSIGFIFQEIYFMLFGYPYKSLAKDIALITGGGGGLGRLLALRLSKLGSKVVIWDINTKGINETTDMIKQMGGFCQGYVVDISNRDEVYKAADIIKRDIGDISLLINNAGVVSGMHLLETPDHLIERSFNVNVMAHFWTTKAFLPKMLENRVGHVVTIASLAGHVGITKLIDYCASKFAAVGFDEALRLELEMLGHERIKTTCICPFFIQQTGMFDDVYARWVSTLNSAAVADRIITAIRRDEKIAIIPGFMKYLLSLKWIFPWGCTAGLLKRLVPDAAPNGLDKKNFALDKVKLPLDGKSTLLDKDEKKSLLNRNIFTLDKDKGLTALDKNISKLSNGKFALNDDKDTTLLNKQKSSLLKDSSTMDNKESVTLNRATTEINESKNDILISTEFSSDQVITDSLRIKKVKEILNEKVH